MKKQNTLFVCALKMETQGKLSDYNVLYTGVGKVNAAFYLTKYLTTRKLPELVINYGSAGSQKITMGELVDCTKFLQRDMDVSTLNFAKGETPFEKQIPAILDLSATKFNPIGKNLICGSGDSFVTDHKNYAGDVVDMEAYALAKVCYFCQIPFIAFKYISDGANTNSSQDWSKNLTFGIQKFQQQILKKIQ